MSTYLTEIQATDNRILYFLAGALPLGWSLREQNGAPFLIWDTQFDVEGDILCGEFQRQVREIEKASKLIKGYPTFELKIKAPLKLLKRDSRGDVEIEVVFFASIKTSQAQSSFAIGFVIDPSLSEQEAAIARESHDQHVDRVKAMEAYNWLLARSYSERYRQVTDDWERQSPPDLRSLAVYIETIYADIKKKEFEKGGRYAELSEEINAFSAVVNNPNHYGIEARHGWGASAVQPYMDKYAYMNREKIFEFATKMIKLWESHLVAEAERAKGPSLK